jgi:hypothetical protein
VQIETIVDLVLTTFVTGAVGALVLTRLSRLEAGQDGLRDEMRQEISGVRGEIGGVRGEMRQELSGVREEIARVREEIAVMRSDLTHVALAVGANRPKPMEG